MEEAVHILGHIVIHSIPERFQAVAICTKMVREGLVVQKLAVLGRLEADASAVRQGSGDAGATGRPEQWKHRYSERKHNRTGHGSGDEAHHKADKARADFSAVAESATIPPAVPKAPAASKPANTPATRPPAASAGAMRAILSLSL